MKIVFELTKKEIDALKAVQQVASGEAEAMISDNDDKSQMKIGYLIEEGCALLGALIRLSGKPLN